MSFEQSCLHMWESQRYDSGFGAFLQLITMGYKFLLLRPHTKSSSLSNGITFAILTLTTHKQLAETPSYKKNR